MAFLQDPAREIVISVEPDGLAFRAKQVGLPAYKLPYSGSIYSYKPTSINSSLACPSLQVHGIIGLVSYGPRFVIAITDCVQVAGIYNCNVYNVSSVVIIPLEYSGAIKAVSKAQRKRREPTKSQDFDSKTDESEDEDNDNDDPLKDPDLEDLDHDKDVPIVPFLTRRSSIVEDVMLHKTTTLPRRWFWFSKPENVDIKPVSPATPMSPATPVYQSSLISKLIKSLKDIYCNKGIYFCYDLDLTQTLTISPESVAPNPVFINLRPGFCFNYHLCSELSGTWLALPVIQGFVRSITVPTLLKPTKDQDESISSSPSTFQVIVISRRSTRRAGVRYLRRGIDDQGSCANWVETEQLLVNNTSVSGFTQVRGSIPVYFSQSPYKLQPVPKIRRTFAETKMAFSRHFDNLKEYYGEVVAISLVEKPPSRESGVGSLYQELALDAQLHLVWFDFHAACKGMRFDQVERLFDPDTQVLDRLQDFAWTNTSRGRKQIGIFRINCIDCLDRTNVVQTSCGRQVLLLQLEEEELDILDKEGFNLAFNGLWADNGDAISRQYSSTNALKGDFTRTRIRNYRGVLNDAFLTLSRYFYGIVSDFFTQAVVDFILGSVDGRVFDEFEARLQTTDPAGLPSSFASSLEGMEGVITSAKSSTVPWKSNLIETAAAFVLESESETLYGGWWLLTPMKDGKLRKVPLRPCVLLITDAAIYRCIFDADTDKVTECTRVVNAKIYEIQVGSFFTDTLSKASIEALMNRGFMLKFPCSESYNYSDKSQLPAHISHSVYEEENGGKSVISDGNDDLSSSSPSTSASPITELRSFMAFKIPLHQEPDQILRMVQAACSNAQTKHADLVSLAQANADTSIWDMLEYHAKRLVWA